jgi:rhodanese-related sulfurtransferase
MKALKKHTSDSHFFCIPFLIVLGVTVHVSCAATREVSTDMRTVYPHRLEELVNECSLEYLDVTWITLEDFEKRRDTEKWIIIDARSVIERAISIIPGALSKEEFEMDMETHRGSNILIYCTVGCRCGAYARELQHMGFRSFDLWGGVLAWAWAGKEYSTPEGLSTRAVHVFGPKWNVLPQGYEGGW